MSPLTAAIARAGRLLGALHRRLLPTNADIGWTPYLWLFYLGFFIVRLVDSPFDGRVFGFGILSLIVFLALYFNGYWQTGRRILWNVAGMVALGVVWTPHNFGAMTFFIFGTGFCGLVGPPQTGRRLLAAIIVSVLATAWLFEMPWFWLLITVPICFMVGATNIYFCEMGRKNADLRRSREEVERLAAVAERERIARDLHDLLGHTLTLITLKAELARRLVERGDERAAREIADVEKISRDALSQVREAVTGFRDIGLAGELKRARMTLDAAGIVVTSDLAEIELDARREATLAMVLREAVTNVVRHSRATRCEIRLEIAASTLVLTVEDDGRGGGPTLAGANAGTSGQGLAGMRQRLLDLGGFLETEASGGWKVRAVMPIPKQAAEAAADTTAGDVAEDLYPRPAEGTA